MNLLIRGGRIIDPGASLDAVGDIAIAGGRIAAVGDIPKEFRPDQTIDATGMLVLPGLVELHARLREPGQERKATIASETRAAARGGITTLCCPPDTDPVLDTAAVARLIRQRAAEEGLARVLPYGALTAGLKGEQLAEMAELQEAGCIAMSNARRPVTNTLVMRRALEYAATFGLQVMVYPEDPWLGGGTVHEGPVSTRLGLAGIPDCAEVIGASRDLLLIERAAVKAHFGQISSARTVDLISAARERGLSVTADVTPHHLFLSEMDVGQFNADRHVRPPLRTGRDRDRLRRALADGVLDAVSSDHQPHDSDARLAPFAETEPGFSGLETLLPLVLRLAEEGVVDLSRAIGLVTTGPARVLGIEAGTLAPGASADVCVVDPERWWTVDDDTLVSAGKNTPFRGWELKGKVVHTLFEGRTVYSESGEEK